MPQRLFGVLMVVFMAVALALPALAVEAEGGGEVEMPSYDEIGSGSETSMSFRPEPYEQPTVFAGLLYPLLALAAVAVVAVLGLYLVWQPRFSEEREAKKRK